MSNLNISLPDPVKDFIEEQAAKGGYSSVDEYLLALILQEQKRIVKNHIEELLLEAVDSGERIKVTDEWWEQERQELIAEFMNKEA
jgi:antitoxin ParD1/3/4